jgi:dTDP-glucose 4,6-dehydratase
MKVLVTGGAGFIGANFLRRSMVTRPDNTFVCFDALTYAGDIKNLPENHEDMTNLTFIQGDIRNSSEVASALEGVDVVVHFAAETHNDNSLASPEAFISTNINGTFVLIQECLKAGVRFHHVSTDEVFGDFEVDSQEKFSEDTPYAPSSPYSASKAASDHLVRAWVRSFGLKATISNCSNNFGPLQHEEKLIPRTVKLAQAGIRPKIYGDGSNVRDWIYVDDHTDGIWAVLDRGVIGETYLLGASNEISNLNLVRDILQIMGLGEDFIEFVEDRPGHDRRYAINASKAIKTLGWAPDNSRFPSQLESTVKSYLISVP